MTFLRLQLNQKHSTVVSGTTPSGCTQRAPTGSVTFQLTWFVQSVKKTYDLFSDHSRLPAVDHGLGDYTQWVHSACPHWFHDSIRPDRVEKVKRKSSRYKDYSRLPAVHHSLGDYTQWVHSACPHQSKNSIDTPSGCTDTKIFGKKVFR